MISVEEMEVVKFQNDSLKNLLLVKELEYAIEKNVIIISGSSRFFRDSIRSEVFQRYVYLLH